MNLTKIALKRPVSVILIVIALMVFGVSSIFGFRMELQPDVELPMLMVVTSYPGADRETIENVVTQKIEDAGAVLNGIESYRSVINENYTVTMFSYNYDTNIDDAYMDLRVAIDSAKSELPDDTKEPYIVELSLESTDIVKVSAATVGDVDLLNYVDSSIVPELESVLGVANADVYGGKENYIKVELNQNALEQYGLDMSTISQCIAAVDYDVPAGSVTQGSQEVPVSASSKVNNLNELKNVPVVTSTGSIISLGEVASISMNSKDAKTISRYNGDENITIGIQKKQSYGTVNVAKKLEKKIEELNKENESVKLDVIYNSSENIVSSLLSVLNTLLLGVIISMIILFIFFGDIRASLIVGSSMPISVFATMILMYLFGFSLNIVTTSALVIAIGMMVDNAIVVIESCFRAKDNTDDSDEVYRACTYKGTKIVTSSVIASTITTVVVYLPLSLMNGLSGQLFSQLGLTIIFAMVSSLISSITLVPLLFSKFKPVEKKDFFANRMINKILCIYEKILRKILYNKKRAVLFAVSLLVFSGILIYSSNCELIPSTDEGIINVAAEFRAGSTLEKMNEQIIAVEKIIKNNKGVDNYLLTIEENTANIVVYLKDDKDINTASIVEKLNMKLAKISNMDITVTETNSSNTSYSVNGVEIDLTGDDLTSLKEAANMVEEEMLTTNGVIKVDNDFSANITQAKVQIDELKAMNHGITSVQVAVAMNNALSGVNSTTIASDGNEYDVIVEYPKGTYDNVNDLLNLAVKTKLGNTVILSEIANVNYSNSIQSVIKQNGKYQVAITAYTTQDSKFDVKDSINSAVEKMNFKNGISQTESQINEMMGEEYITICIAILSAIFLVFLVMAMQFESPRFSLMVMMSIPFGFIGSFGLLYLSGSTLSLVSLMGNLMLVGIVVNDGILYVDTVNMLKKDMELEEALIASGRLRFRPIMMTTLTTVLSMIPMIVLNDSSSKMMEGMAYVIIGGLSTSTIIILILMPTFYLIINKKRI